MDGVESFVVAVNDSHIRGVTATVIVGYIAGAVYYATGTSGIIILWFRGSIFPS